MIKRDTILLVLAATLLAGSVGPALGEVLVGDVFIDQYNGWVDTFTGIPEAGQPPAWSIHLRNSTLTENSNGRARDGSDGDGSYTPFVMINTLIDPGELPPAYTLSATLQSADNDGLGVVFSFQDTDNYFRVGLCRQESGYGFPQGVAVQKVIGGVVTQISGPDTTFIPPVGSVPFDVDVAVSGSSCTVSVNGTPLLSFVDSDLAALSPGHVGVMSWGQRQYASVMGIWGTELTSMTVTCEGLSVEHAFTSPIAWRPLQMTNASGAQGADGSDLGNFRLDFRSATIQDDSNGAQSATVPGIDFIGPAIVIDEPGSDAFSDYQMMVRLTNQDNDGIGVLLRVQDDDTFYRVNFASQAMDPAGERAPRGLSIQKVAGGVWSELFRDDQVNPLWVPTHGTGSVGDGNEVPYDLIVRAVGNKLAVQVISDPDGAAEVITYPIVTDTSDPLLSGTVGLTNWGSGGAGNGAIFSRFGNAPGPLLVEIAEPGAAGDADLDGDVDLDDFTIVKMNFGAAAGAICEMGDLNGDGAVDLDDFVVLKLNFGWISGDILTLDLGGGVTMDLVGIPADAFMMGSLETESGHEADEGPVHEVILSQNFYMGIYEVTQAQYQAVMGTNPSDFTASGLTAPVENVSWDDAIAFCQQLSLLTGKTVTLPTEAQWEYACRAGSTTPWYYGGDPFLLSDYAWWDDGATSETHRVGQRSPNAWGLYDMSGNVWEWCSDWYAEDYYSYANTVDPQGPATGTYRVLRGGCWGSFWSDCRSANRHRITPSHASSLVGFRVVVVLGAME